MGDAEENEDCEGGEGYWAGDAVYKRCFWSESSVVSE